jgi:hypothetical protein
MIKGDTGEGLWISQYWVMFSTVDRTAHTTVLTTTGLLESGAGRADMLWYITTRKNGKGGRRRYSATGHVHVSVLTQRQ